MKNRITACALILLLSGCSVTHIRYKARRHHNKVAQDVIQNEHGISSGKDWTRAWRHWDERPKGHWPFQFLH